MAPKTKTMGSFEGRAFTRSIGSISVPVTEVPTRKKQKSNQTHRVKYRFFLLRWEDGWWSGSWWPSWAFGCLPRNESSACGATGLGWVWIWNHKPNTHQSSESLVCTWNTDLGIDLNEDVLLGTNINLQRGWKRGRITMYLQISFLVQWTIEEGQ